MRNYRAISSPDSWTYVYRKNIFDGLDADKPNLVDGILFSFDGYAQGLGYRISDNTLWGVEISAYRLTKYSATGEVLDFWNLNGGSSGCEIDGDNDDFLWVSTRLDRIAKYRLSTRANVAEVEYSNMAEIGGIIRSVNGICAPAGEFLYYGIAGSEPEVRKMRKSDGAIVATYNLVNEPSDLAWDGTNIRVSYIDYPAIDCFNPADFSLISTFNSPYAANQGLTWDDHNLWVSYPTDNKISKLGNATSSPANIYYATDTEKFYWNVEGTWKEVPKGVDNFLGNIDTPDSYTGQAGKFLSVNSTEDGLEFIVSGGGSAAGVSSLAKVGSALLTGDIVLEAGANVTLSQDDTTKKITIAATGGGGAGGVSKQWFRTYTPTVTGLSTSAYATKGMLLQPDINVIVHGISMLTNEPTTSQIKVALYELNGVNQVGAVLVESGIIQGGESKQCNYKLPVPFTMIAGKTYVLAIRNVTAGATSIIAFTSAGVSGDNFWGMNGDYARIITANPQAGSVWEVVTTNAPFHGGMLIEV